MKTRLLLALTATLLLAGCATEPSLPEKLATVRPEASAISFDDPLPIFTKVFPHGYLPLQKDPLETNAEFEARLQQTGIIGKEYVFLLSPEVCEIDPLPEQNFYVIMSKDYFYDGWQADPKPYGVTVLQKEESPRTYTGQNAYGAQAEVTAFSSTEYRLHFENLLRQPSITRWYKGEMRSFLHFGLPVRTADPTFRSLLREKKIGLAVRVRIGDLKKATQDTIGTTATITKPTSLNITMLILPVHLLDAWVVDTTSNTSVVHWVATP